VDKSDKIERDRIISALERLKTPRDAAYEAEIQKLKDKYVRLESEYNATRELLSELEDTLGRSTNKQMIDLGNVVRTELVHIKSIRDNYELSLERSYGESMMYAECVTQETQRSGY
jgi:hypothetical protein